MPTHGINRNLISHSKQLCYVVVRKIFTGSVSVGCTGSLSTLGCWFLPNAATATSARSSGLIGASGSDFRIRVNTASSNCIGSTNAHPRREPVVSWRSSYVTHSFYSYMYDHMPVHSAYTTISPGCASNSFGIQGIGTIVVCNRMIVAFGLIDGSWKGRSRLFTDRSYAMV